MYMYVGSYMYGYVFSRMILPLFYRMSRQSTEVRYAFDSLNVYI